MPQQTENKVQFYMYFCKMAESKGKSECDSLYSKMLEIPFLNKVNMASRTLIIVNSITCLYLLEISTHCYTNLKKSKNNLIWSLFYIFYFLSYIIIIYYFFLRRRSFKVLFYSGNAFLSSCIFGSDDFVFKFLRISFDIIVVSLF